MPMIVRERPVYVEIQVVFLGCVARLASPVVLEHL